MDANVVIAELGGANVLRGAIPAVSKIVQDQSTVKSGVHAFADWLAKKGGFSIPNATCQQVADFTQRMADLGRSTKAGDMLVGASAAASGHPFLSGDSQLVNGMRALGYTAVNFLKDLW